MRLNIVPYESELSMRAHLTGTNVALIAVFAAFIAASTAVPEVMLAFGVPLSLQTFAVVLAGLVLGPWRAAAAVMLYVTVGVAGAPIFANFRAGPSIFAGPTGGYLVGMVLAALVVGAVTLLLRTTGRLGFGRLFLAALVSLPVIYAVGVPWLASRTGLPVAGAPPGCEAWLDFSEGCANALTVGVIPFLPGDLLKVIAAAGAAAVIHRAFPQLMPARAQAGPQVERDGALSA